MAESSELEFQIYNSMTKQKEKLKPIVPGKVSMYICGVMSYDFSHIGHARAYVAFDVLFRVDKLAQPVGPRKARVAHRVQCNECNLTEKFAIHGGGMDLIFPHHENEIAQSCAACPNSKINYWMHNGFVTANDEKMSKSVGNFFTIREVMKLYHPLALRHFLMGTHYRSPVNYSIAQIEISSDAVYYIYQTLEDCAISRRD